MAAGHDDADVAANQLLHPALAEPGALCVGITSDISEVGEALRHTHCGSEQIARDVERRLRDAGLGACSKPSGGTIVYIAKK